MKLKLIKICIIGILITAAYTNIAQSNNQSTQLKAVNITPNDYFFELQWNLENTGQSNPYSGEGTPDCDIDASEAWVMETGNSDIIIAVIDSGIDYNHPDLAENIWINKDEIPDNDIDDDNNGYIDDVRGWNFLDDNNEVEDIAGHGTACAGVAAAVANNEIGIAGVCWNCQIMTVIADTGFDDCPEDAVADGIKYAADNGADVISLSIGTYSYSDLVLDAVNYAYNKGIVLVGAVGNEGKDTKSYPAGYDNVIAVGATDNTDTRMDAVRWGIIHGISDYGDWVDIAAPGLDIYVTLPTYRVAFNDLLGVSTNYDYMSGTSFSCPQVSGLAALMLSRNQDLTPDQVKQIICSNVDPYDSDVYIGTGRINAFKALSAANTPPSVPEVNGSDEGEVGVEYTFYATSSDIEGDQIWYAFDWGIKDQIIVWQGGPYDSGETVDSSIVWSEEGTYQVRVKAKDIYDIESDWSEPIEVTMPKPKSHLNPFLLFLENHPYLFPLFQRILGI